MKTYVIGHKNPDCDSVVSAIAYAELKNKLGYRNVKPARAGKLNEQTTWVLTFFKQKPPILLENVRKKAKEVMVKRVIYVKKTDRVKKAIKLIYKHGVRFLPVIENNKPIGIFSVVDFTKYFIEFINKKKTSDIERFLKSKIEEFYDKEIETCLESDIEETLEKKILKSKHKGLIVLNKNKNMTGIITKTNLLKPRSINLILVDHNELTQAVDGAITVNILEVIDHHRLGSFQTLQPIKFIIEPVGSTSTIIADTYFKNKVKLSKQIAGLLLSGILSDTIGLTSSTTTQKDKVIAQRLSNISGIKISYITQKFKELVEIGVRDMLKKPAKDIIKNDFKSYIANDKKIGIGQLETTNFDKFYNLKQDLKLGLEQIMREEKYDLMCLAVTNISQKNTILLCVGDRKILEQIPWPIIQENLYDLKGVVSRKKQIMPILLGIINSKEEKTEHIKDFYFKKREK